jgi:hypothetical protein
LLLWATLLWPTAANAQFDTGSVHAPWQLPPNASPGNSTAVGWQSTGQVPAGSVVDSQPVDMPYPANTRAGYQAKNLPVSQALPVDDQGRVTSAPAGQPQTAPYVDSGDPQGPGGGMSFGPGPCACQGPGVCAGCGNDWLLGFPILAPLVNGCQDRLWVRAEYLVWWMKGADVPPLLTSGSSTDPVPGALLQPGTQVLFGGGELNNGARSGGRLTLDYWLCPCQQYGIEASYFSLAPQETEYSQTNPGTAVLARPYFNVNTGTYAATVVTTPSVAGGPSASGLIDGRLTTDFQGGDLLFRRAIYQQCGERLDFLIGYRYAQLIDNLRVDSSSTIASTGGAFPIGTTAALADSFDTRNEFHGLEIGIQHQYRYNQWSLDLLAKTALGDTMSQVNINGSTATINPAGTVTSIVPGGLLALPTNTAGSPYHRNDFAMIPELGATLTLDLSARLQFTAGYSLIYWSKVARAGDQVDTSVNTTQQSGGTLTGNPNPRFPYAFTDFWAQGANLGLEYKF